MYKDIVIVSAIRTPFGRYCGALKEYDYFDLGAIPMKAVLERVGLPGDQVDEVFWGVGDTSVCKDVYTSGGAPARRSSKLGSLPKRLQFLSIRHVFRQCRLSIMAAAPWLPVK